MNAHMMETGLELWSSIGNPSVRRISLPPFLPSRWTQLLGVPLYASKFTTATFNKPPLPKNSRPLKQGYFCSWYILCSALIEITLSYLINLVCGQIFLINVVPGPGGKDTFISISLVVGPNSKNTSRHNGTSPTITPSLAAITCNNCQFSVLWK